MAAENVGEGGVEPLFVADFDGEFFVGREFGEEWFEQIEEIELRREFDFFEKWELEDERAEFLTELGLEEPGLNRVIRAGYRLLGLQTFFTAGPKEVRAWTVRSGASAPQAAGVIHTDFERGFIRAEIISFADYIACKGEAGARDAGKMRLEGKDYLVQEGDVIHFRFNV